MFGYLELLFLFSMEKGGEPGALYLHCALGAELLTAEASDAELSVDNCLAVLDDDGFCGTDILTDAAADAKLFIKSRLGFKDEGGDFAEEILDGVFALAPEAE